VWAVVAKEFRQLSRDRRTLAMMIALPVLMLVVFGYAASFNVRQIPTAVVGPGAQHAAASLRAPFQVTQVDAHAGAASARSDLADGSDVVALVSSGAGGLSVLIDGTQIFSAQAAESALAHTSQAAAAAHITMLYNPKLQTSWIMVPGLAGLILAFVGTVITSLGVVRERQAGTLEQLAVMPLRPWDVISGKIVPYFIVAAVDLTAIVLIGKALFSVPFAGNIGVFALGAVLFLLVTLGLGVLISTVSQNQGQAIQLALMVLLPQILLSGLIFPVSSMAAGVRWISYILPLTYFIRISRAVMLKGTAITALWQPLLLLALLGVAVLTLAVLRFRRDLAPSSRAASPEAPVAESVSA
jgi:ABC-2 type transport system permease protein